MQDGSSGRVSGKGAIGGPRTTRRLLPGLAVRDGFMRHPFDVEHGVRTSGLIAGRDLPTGHPHDRHNTAYYGVAPSVFRAIVKKWRASHPLSRIEDYTFIDFGAGMGRAMLLAGEMAFREVAGIELHPVLVGIARRNLTRWRTLGFARAPMQILHQDALEFSFPSNPCVAFLFNPFAGPVLKRLLGRIAASFAQRPGELDLLYVNREQEAVLEGHAGFQRLFLGEIRRSRADAIADHSILANQPDGEYESANHENCSIHRWVGMQKLPGRSRGLASGTR